MTQSGGNTRPVGDVAQPSRTGTEDHEAVSTDSRNDQAPVDPASSDSSGRLDQGPAHAQISGGSIPPGSPPPKVSVEVWDGPDAEAEQVEAHLADVVRIDDTWHVVVALGPPPEPVHHPACVKYGDDSGCDPCNR